MKPKTRAGVYNFLGFAILFLILRFALGYFFDGIGRFYLALASAIAASVLAPKFAVVKEGAREKLMMKWIFIKGFREI
ncbi:hypothetical protein [Maribacter luteus]|uniref:Uncharacterized protein n=1 Tax=Maribacter luteus TaxID=2594478 RepID=A0A6I2MS47_9FLAO|nr:hypothetical protein [Maribacter luteus]MRX65707.1 hypothetical protein [Maribacter luteus]